MSEEELQRIKAHALEQVNAILSEFGHAELSELPKGVPGGSCDCPVALALAPCGVLAVEPNLLFNAIDNAHRCMRVVKNGRLGRVVGLPMVIVGEELAQFVHDFDEELYPELILA